MHARRFAEARMRLEQTQIVGGWDGDAYNNNNKKDPEAHLFRILLFDKWEGGRDVTLHSPHAANRRQ